MVHQNEFWFCCTMVSTARLSYVSYEIGPELPLSIVEELLKKKATHINLHGNRLASLDIPSTWKHRRKNETCVGHIVELVLSSNSLHKGYSLPHIVPPRDSLLILAPTLLRLNLAANDLTEKSLFGLLTNRKNTFGALSNLHELDISHNNILRLPKDMHSIVPNLRCLNATSNKIKSLSSTLQALHPYRGILESLQFGDAKNRDQARSRDNPIRFSKFYREKLVFVLGDTLNRLDCVAITHIEREQIRITLQNDMPKTDEILPPDKMKEGLSNIATIHPLPQCPDLLENGLNLEARSLNRRDCDLRSRQKQDGEKERAKRTCDLECDDSFPDEYAVVNKNPENSSKDKKNLQDEIVLLSAMVGNQAHLTQELLRYAHVSNAHSSEINMGSMLRNRIPDYPKGNAVEKADIMNISVGIQTMSTNGSRQISYFDRQQALLSLMIKFAFNQKEETMKRTKRCLAFSKWSLSTNVSKYKTHLDNQLVRSEHKWKKRAIEQVQEEREREKEENAAVQEENRCLNRKISLMSKEIEDMKSKVESETTDRMSLSQRLQDDKAALKRTYWEMETKLRNSIEEKEDQVMRLVAERDRLNHQLGRVKLASDEERQRACQQLEQSASVGDAKLDEMKAQMRQKDVRTLYHAFAEFSPLYLRHLFDSFAIQATISKLKSAYEQAIMKAASEKSKREEAIMSERQAKELLQKQSQKLCRLESELEKATAAKSKVEASSSKYAMEHNNLKKDLEASMLKISDLSDEVKKLQSIMEENESKLRISESRIKFVSDEKEEIHKQKSHWEAKYERLHEKLEQATENLREAKRCTVHKDRLEEEIAKRSQVERDFVNFRHSAQEVESQERARTKELRKENAALKKTAKEQENVIKSLNRKLQSTKNESKSVEMNILSKHKMELQRLKSESDNEIDSLKKRLEMECKFRFAAIDMSKLFPILTRRVSLIITQTVQQ